MKPFYRKLCRDEVTEKDTINKHMIYHVENVLDEDIDAKASIK